VQVASSARHLSHVFCEKIPASQPASLAAMHAVSSCGHEPQNASTAETIVASQTAVNVRALAELQKVPYVSTSPVGTMLSGHVTESDGQAPSV